MNDELVEKVADFMHDQWSHWMKYLYSKLQNHPMDIKVYKATSPPIDAGFSEAPKMIGYIDYEHWKRQMTTPYAELSDKEQESDREWARKMIDLLIKKGYI